MLWIIPIWIFSIIGVACVVGGMRAGKIWDEKFAEEIITNQRNEIIRLRKVVDTKIEIQILEADRNHEDVKKLEEEKEWLLSGYVDTQYFPNSMNMVDKSQIRGDIIRRMQKALKEKK